MHKIFDGKLFNMIKCFKIQSFIITKFYRDIDNFIYIFVYRASGVLLSNLW